MAMKGSATQFPGQARRCGILLSRKLDSTTLPLPDFFQAALVSPLNRKIAQHTRRFTTRIKHGNFSLHIGHINVLNRVVLSTPGLRDAISRARGLNAINQVLKPHGFELVFNVATAKVDLIFDFVEKGSFSQTPGEQDFGEQVDMVLAAQQERLGEIGVFRRSPTSERLTDDLILRHRDEIRDILLSEVKNPIPDMNVLSQAAAYLCRQGYLDAFLEVGEIFFKRGERIIDFFEFNPERKRQVFEIILRLAQINYLAGHYARAEEVMVSEAVSFLEYAFEETLVWYSLIRTRQRNGIPLAHFLASERVASEDPSLLERTLLLNARLYASLFAVPSEEDLMEFVFEREELEKTEDDFIKELLESTRIIMQWIYLLLGDLNEAESIGNSYQEEDDPFFFNALGAILLSKKEEDPERLAKAARLSDTRIERKICDALERYTDNFVDKEQDIVQAAEPKTFVNKYGGGCGSFVAVHKMLNEIAPLSDEEDDGDQGDGEKPPYSPPSAEPEALVRDAEHTVDAYWIPLLKQAFPRGDREELIETYRRERQSLRELLAEARINYEHIFRIEREITQVLPLVPVIERFYVPGGTAVPEKVDVLNELNVSRVTLVWNQGLKVRVYLAERTWKDPEYLEEEVLLETLSLNLDEDFLVKHSYAAMFLELLIMYGIQETMVAAAK